MNYSAEGHTLRFVGKRPKTDKEGLALAIEKWQILARENKAQDRIIYDGADATCGLCMLYFNKGCVGCPIADATEETFCVDNAGYQAYHNADTVDEAIEAAEQEVAFLQSLE